MLGGDIWAGSKRNLSLYLLSHSKPFLKGPPGGVFPRLLNKPGRGATAGEKAECLEPGITTWATQQKPGTGRQELRK